MKKLLFVILLASMLPVSSCKKEYCWTCTQTNSGNDEEFCNMTKKEAERKEGTGYTCVRK